MSAYRVGVFVSRSDSAWGTAIALATWMPWERLADIPSHAGMIYDTGNGSPVIAEALAPQVVQRDEHGEGLHVHAGGWVVGKPYAQVQAWAAGRPGRWTRAYWLSELDGSAAEAAYAEALNMLGYWVYSVPQLVYMLGYYRFGKAPPKTSPLQVMCSEAVARILSSTVASPAYDIAASCKRPSADAVSPADVWRWGRGLGV